VCVGMCDRGGRRDNGVAHRSASRREVAESWQDAPGVKPGWGRRPGEIPPLHRQLGIAPACRFGLPRDRSRFPDLWPRNTGRHATTVAVPHGSRDLAASGSERWDPASGWSDFSPFVIWGHFAVVWEVLLHAGVDGRRGRGGLHLTNEEPHCVLRRNTYDIP
jgi:hypothetical protein